MKARSENPRLPGAVEAAGLGRMSRRADGPVAVGPEGVKEAGVGEERHHPVRMFEVVRLAGAVEAAGPGLTNRLMPGADEPRVRDEVVDVAAIHLHRLRNGLARPCVAGVKNRGKERSPRPRRTEEARRRRPRPLYGASRLHSAKGNGIRRPRDP